MKFLQIFVRDKKMNGKWKNNSGKVPELKEFCLVQLRLIE